MSLVNSKVRFAVDDTDGRVFCYLTNRYFLPTGELTAPDGVWDLAKVKAAILANDFIESARIQAAPPHPDAVAQANAAFEAAVDAEIARRATAGNAPTP